MYKNPNISRKMRHKTLWDFHMKTDHPISARRPDIVRLRASGLQLFLGDYEWN